MSNTYDPTNEITSVRDRVRLLIGDTDTTVGKYVFDDVEIDVFVDLANDDPFRAASDALYSLAADASKHAVAIRVLAGDEIDKKSASDRLMRLAMQLATRSDQAPAQAVTTFENLSGDYIDETLGSRSTFDFDEQDGVE